MKTKDALVCDVSASHDDFTGWGPGAFEGWGAALVSEPECVHALFEKSLGVWMTTLKGFARAVGEKVAIMQITDDLATQESLGLSVKTFRELIMPYYECGWNWAHQNTKMKVMLHSESS